MSFLNDALELLESVSSVVPVRRAISVIIFIVCIVVLRRIWNKSVIQFKKGMLAHDDPPPAAEPPDHPRKPTLKKSWDAQFIRFCRASGLTARTLGKEWKKLRRDPNSTSK